MLQIKIGLTTYGKVGTKTGTTLSKTDVCVGDTVEISKTSTHVAGKGLVVYFDNYFTVLGYESFKIDDLSIKKISKSHKNLKDTDKLKHLKSIIKIENNMALN